MSEWQPIETAPKDGTLILGYDDGLVTVVRWVPMSGYWSLAQSGDYAEGDEWPPTHWHPLPELPE